METTTVLLDAGGVILDESEYEQLKAEIISRTLETIVPGYSVHDYYSDIEEAVKSFCPDAYHYVIWKNSSGDTLLFGRLYESFRAAMRQRVSDIKMKLSRGIEEEVQEISGKHSLGIAGQYGRDILEILERQSILSCFAHQYTQDDFSITKPDPRYYQQIANACGVDPQQCIMVGDRTDKDMVPAKMLGMKTVLIRTGLHKNQQARIPHELADIELPSVIGLADAVEELANRY